MKSTQFNTYTTVLNCTGYIYLDCGAKMLWSMSKGALITKESKDTKFSDIPVPILSFPPWLVTPSFPYLFLLNIILQSTQPLSVFPLITIKGCCGYVLQWVTKEKLSWKNLFKIA